MPPVSPTYMHTHILPLHITHTDMLPSHTRTPSTDAYKNLNHAIPGSSTTQNTHTLSHRAHMHGYTHTKTPPSINLSLTQTFSDTNTHAEEETQLHPLPTQTHNNTLFSPSRTHTHTHTFTTTVMHADICTHDHLQTPNMHAHTEYLPLTYMRAFMQVHTHTHTFTNLHMYVHIHSIYPPLTHRHSHKPSHGCCGHVGSLMYTHIVVDTPSRARIIAQQ